ncbi:PREDICTED: uncharacterized protein C5orf34 homolog [Myotis brandtii]|uniref:uncharacterized protein C5orf34 homolog n=1 Tax=Myotis brandtii TaxID=109478 RepID=UPI0003BB77A7|nr:PREDICTED: uncharacterized protein C5orf34 homolog [Myotis brandtii]
MAAEVRMVLYEDDSVQVQYADGSRLQLSPCGSEFLFEKAPPVSAHPLEQPERIRQRTHFAISTYREQLQRALDFRNAFATCPFLSESIIPPERKKRILIDIPEVRWPSLDTDGGMICMQSGAVKVPSVDGHAYLCLPKSQQEFTVHFLCKVSQKPGSSVVLSEKNNQAPKEQVGKADKPRAYGSLPGQRRKNKENELHCQIVKPKGPSEKKPCGNRTEGEEALPLPGPKHSCVHAWVEQRCSVASCPEEWKYPLSLALRFHNKISNMSGTDVTIPQSTVLTSAAAAEERGKEVSVLPKALLLSCPVPHLHRWTFCDSLSQGQSDEEEYSYSELVKVVWHKGITYRLTHKNVNSIEIYPGDGSVFKSEGAYLGKYFTYYSIQEGSEEKEEKMYSVNNLPPERPGSLFSVCSLIKQATRILQHCAKMRLSLSHNYRICCWKMVPGIKENMLPLLLRELFIPSVGRFLAYSDDKVHVIFIDGVTLTLNWNFGSFNEKRQINQGLNLGWCKLTFPDGHNQLIQIEHPGPYERCVASELEKIQKFNLLLENSGVLNQISNKKNEQSFDCKPNYSESLLEEVNEKRVSVALKRTSEIIQDIDCLLSSSKK